MEHNSKNAPARPCSASCHKPYRTDLSNELPGPEETVSLRLSPPPTATTRPLSASTQKLLADDSIKLAILLTAHMFSLSRESLIVTLRVGLPALSRLVDVNPLLLARMYAASRHKLPETIERYYSSLAESPFLRQTLLDDYRATYGGMLDTVNRLAGQQAGLTDGQAREALAAMLPAINQRLGQANTGGVGEYARLLREIEV